MEEKQAGKVASPQGPQPLSPQPGHLPSTHLWCLVLWLTGSPPHLESMGEVSRVPRPPPHLVSPALPSPAHCAAAAGREVHCEAGSGPPPPHLRVATPRRSRSAAGAGPSAQPWGPAGGCASAAAQAGVAGTPAEGMFWVSQLGGQAGPRSRKRRSAQGAHAAGGPEAARGGQGLGPDTAQLF